VPNARVCEEFANGDRLIRRGADIAAGLQMATGAYGLAELGENGRGTEKRLERVTPLTFAA
jgi:hypothetical protein